MPKVKLTKSSVDAIGDTSRDEFHWDSILAGFGLRVRRGGSKTFVVQYRVGGGRSGTDRRFTIGRYGVFTVDKARAEAKRILGAVANGLDPAAVRYAKRREMTVAQLIVLYCREGTGHLRPTNGNIDAAQMANHVVPLLGSKRFPRSALPTLTNSCAM